VATRASSLHATFFLRAVGRGRIDLTAVVAGQRAVAAIEGRLFAEPEGRAHHRGFEIGGDHGLHHTAEVFEGLDMQRHPGRHPLIEDNAREQMATVGQPHHKHPRLAQYALRRIVELAHVAEVHLGDLAGSAHHRDRDVRGVHGLLAAQPGV